MNIEDLKNFGCYQEGHFELSSGLHSDVYLQCAKLLQTWQGMNLVKDRFAEELVKSKIDIKNIDVVIGGAYGGIRFSSVVAWLIGDCLRSNKEPDKIVRGIWCERVPEVEWSVTEGIEPHLIFGKFQLRRGFEIKKGEKVLIAEDVTTTGKSIGEVAELVKEHGGEIVGAISIIDRRKEKLNNVLEWYDEGEHEADGWMCKLKPFISLIQLDINTWNPEEKECPLCKDETENRLKLIKPGSKK